MERTTTASLTVLAVIAVGASGTPMDLSGLRSQGSNTVHVAPATGRQDADRASILAALARARAGDTVRFAPGTYVVGPLIRVAVPRVTLLGHPDETTLRGCEPAEFVDIDVAPFACNGLELTAGHQTIRNLTFEYAWHGLFVGCCFPADTASLRTGDSRQRSQIGGHLIEGNTFRYSSNGIRVIGESAEPTVVRGNRFINVYHAIGVNGRTTHFLNNDISVTEPHRVPITLRPGGAINVLPFSESGPPDHTSCAGNVIAGNRVEGHPDGIHIILARPGTTCRDNVIRENTIVVRRVRYTSALVGIRIHNETDSTVVGVAIGLINYPAAAGRAGGPGQEAILEGNVVEGNLVMGAEGLGIELQHASRNRIVNNGITGIRRRDPFPGNILGRAPDWRDANGSGIWVSRGSNENEITGNTFEDIAAYAVVLEGDSNRVQVRSAGDSVRDLGKGNRVGRPESSSKETASDPDHPPTEKDRLLRDRPGRQH